MDGEARLGEFTPSQGCSVSEPPLGTGDSEWGPHVFPACETPTANNLSFAPAKYFIGGVDEFDGAIPRLPVTLTTGVFINTRDRGREEPRPPLQVTTESG